MESISPRIRRRAEGKWDLALVAVLFAIVTFMLTAAVSLSASKPEKGDLIYAQGTVSHLGDHWGHVAIYIGDYKVTRKGGYTLRDPIFDVSPLKVSRNGKPVLLKRGQKIKKGDLIVRAVVEMRETGAVFNTVDGVRRIASIYGPYPKKKLIDWKTTNPPPKKEQRVKICRLAVSKVDLTEEGDLEYDAGEKGSKDWWSGNEEFDCVNLAEWCYEQVDLNPTPDSYEGDLDYLWPQEQYDNIDRRVEELTNILGTWHGGGNSTYVVKQEKNKISWDGTGKFAGRNWHHKAKGTITGNTITAKWEDLRDSGFYPNSGNVTGTVSADGKTITWTGDFNPLERTWTKKDSHRSLNSRQAGEVKSS